MSLGGGGGGWPFGDSESESEDERNSFVGVSINSGNNYTAFGNNFGNVGVLGRIVVNGRDWGAVLLWTLHVHGVTRFLDSARSRHAVAIEE
jgi:hypothetical protein